MTRAELDALIKQTAQATAEQITARISHPPTDDLWDARQCGGYLGVSAYTVAHDWAHQRGFPAAVVLGDGPRAKRRWKADEIKEWAAGRQQRKAA